MTEWNVTIKRAARYALLPEFLPRLNSFGRGAFIHIAFFMAQIFRAAGLLPAGHPYLVAANIGRFGVRHVVAQAANNLKFDFKHIDQILIFGALLVGLVILAVQFGLLLLAMISSSAFANNYWGYMPTNFAQFFITADPTHDIAFIILDRVFGVPHMYDSCIALNEPCLNLGGRANVTAFSTSSNTGDGKFPYPFHIALHMLFQLYSIALMVIAVLIFCYFITAVVGETAKDGTPFGRRFNHVWAPIRMVVALGLLVPVSYGLNSGQYIVLYAAKWGSGFATNGWLLFNKILTGNYLGSDGQTLVAEPEIPEVNRLVQFALAAQTCYFSYAQTYGDDPKWDNFFKNFDAWIVKDTFSTPNAIPFAPVEFDEALQFTENQDIIIRFGERDPTGKKYFNHRGFVYPHCGEIKLTVTGIKEPGARAIQNGYYDMIYNLWLDGVTEYYAQEIAKAFMPQTNDPQADLPDNDYRVEALKYYTEQARQIVKAGVQVQRDEGNFAIEPELLKYGWGGAAIWYNKIASMNGAVTSAAFDIPEVKLYPSSMEGVLQERLQADADVTGFNRYDPKISGKRAVDHAESADGMLFNPSYWSYKSFESEDGGLLRPEQLSTTGNSLLDGINEFFGTSGLYNIRKNENQDIHPLAQLASVGKALVEASIRNLLAGGALGIFSGYSGNLGEFISSFLITFALIGLTAGVTLFYVVPFLPFLYFFFAIGTWVKGLFEAMVGVPLWALAHIRIDGEGMPGDAASNGYYMILEIFLRPILIVFGFLGSILIFAAMVRVLHDIFPLVIENLTGFDVRDKDNADLSVIEVMRGPIDEFFFTVIYTIIVYMIGMSSFKLVDLVPNHIMRWMGVSVNVFADEQEDAAQGLMSTVVMGGQNTARQLTGILQSGSGAMSSTLKTITNRGPTT